MRGLGALTSLAMALTCLVAHAENVGRQGGDPAVSMGSHFVLSMLAVPMPDANDARFGELLLWQDVNGNHRTDAGELSGLLQRGIASLSTRYVLSPEIQNGNWLLEHGTATFANGSIVGLVDSYFRIDTVTAEASVLQTVAPPSRCAQSYLSQRRRLVSRSSRPAPYSTHLQRRRNRCRSSIGASRTTRAANRTINGKAVQ